MEPHAPSFTVTPDPEEPIEVTDYYEAMRMGWLDSAADANAEQAPTPVEAPKE